MIPIGIYDDATNFKEISAAMAKDENESNNKSSKVPLCFLCTKKMLFLSQFLTMYQQLRTPTQSVFMKTLKEHPNKMLLDVRTQMVHRSKECFVWGKFNNTKF